VRGGFYDAVLLRAETPGSHRSALRERHLRQLAREFSRSYSRRCFPAFRCVDRGSRAQRLAAAVLRLQLVVA